MHSVIQENLEEYLAGTSTRIVESHLAQCPGCRDEVSGMRAISAMMNTLRSREEFPVPLGFTARITRAVRADAERSFWSVFSMDPAFTRKLALGSLLGLAVLSSYLATHDDDVLAQADHSPEAVISSHNLSSTDQQQHQNGMLITLATYHQ